jgi:hypothetical protein
MTTNSLGRATFKSGQQLSRREKYPVELLFIRHVPCADDDEAGTKNKVPKISARRSEKPLGTPFP